MKNFLLGFVAALGSLLLGWLGWGVAVIVRLFENEVVVVAALLALFAAFLVWKVDQQESDPMSRNRIN